MINFRLLKKGGD